MIVKYISLSLYTTVFEQMSESTSQWVFGQRQQGCFSFFKWTWRMDMVFFPKLKLLENHVYIYNLMLEVHIPITPHMYIYICMYMYMYVYIYIHTYVRTDDGY